jgi:hypothetical protein
MASDRLRDLLRRLFASRREEAGLPSGELRLFLSTMSAATSLAERGAFTEGYDTLVAGLRRAEVLAETRRELWGPGLVLHYRQALERYERRWSVCHSRLA